MKWSVNKSEPQRFRRQRCRRDASSSQSARALWLIIFFLAAAELRAQSVSVGSDSARTGTTVQISIDFNAGSQSVTAISVDLSFSSALSYAGVTVGDAATAAGKTALASGGAGSARILVYGVNQIPIGSGTLATIQLGTSGASPGTYAIQVSGVTASDPQAKPVACSSSGGSVIILPPDTTPPPVISAVASSSITSSSAVITWTTDRLADSQVEYGPDARYGTLGPHDVIMTTSHSSTLRDLDSSATYHYRVRSTDPNGNLVVSGDYVFTTISALTLYYPRLLASNIQSAPDDPLFTGVAFANLDKKPAKLKFTLFDSAGTALSGTGIVNPSTRSLGPGAQLPIVDDELFGSGLASNKSPGWAMMESSTAAVGGFFLMFDAGLTALDGATASSAPMTSLVLPEVESPGFTMFSLDNPNSSAASLKLDIMRADGTTRGSMPLSIGAGAALVADLAADILKGGTLDPSDYLRVTSDRGLIPFEVMGKPASDISALNGLDQAAGAKTIYCPQYVTGGGWQTAVSVVNLDSNAGTVRLRLIGDDASVIGEKSVPVAANGKIRIDDPAFFVPVQQDAPLTQGYLEISSDTLKLTGSVVFGGSGSPSFAAALPLISEAKSSVLFSQLASNSTYFTGLAIINPNSTDAVATIDIYGADGQLQYRSQVLIPSKQRRSKLMTEYFPGLSDFSRSSGYIRLTADKPVASFALFGTNNLRVLAAIPPQPGP